LLAISFVSKKIFSDRVEIDLPLKRFIKALTGVLRRHHCDSLRSTLVNMHAMRELLPILNLHELRLSELVVLADGDELDVLICLDQETMMEAQGNNRADESATLNGLGRLFCLHVPDEEREGTCRDEISGALDVVDGSHILQLLEVLD
jgi:hypothetical protein